MKKWLWVLALVNMMSIGQFVVAQDGSDDMDNRRHKKANEIVQKMRDEGASESDVKAQEKANENAYGHSGHEGEE